MLAKATGSPPKAANGAAVPPVFHDSSPSGMCRRESKLASLRAQRPAPANPAPKHAVCKRSCSGNCNGNCNAPGAGTKGSSPSRAPGYTWYSHSVDGQDRSPPLLLAGWSPEAPEASPSVESLERAVDQPEDEEASDEDDE